MDKRILLPTDFSKNALNAIRYALDMHEKEKCEFYLLNVYQVKGYSTKSIMVPEPGDVDYEAAKKLSLDGLEKQMEILSLREENPKHRFYKISQYNSILYGVKNIIAKKDIDLVVMGTKGAGGTRSTIFGTNTVNIMEKVTECPVLGIPENVRFAPPKEIVFPTDFKASFKRREIQVLLDIAKSHKSPIRVLHIMESSKLSKIQENNKVLLDHMLDVVDHSFHTMSDVKVQKGIDTFIQSRESGMVAFMNKKHMFFGSILSNPLVKELGYYSEIPILVLKDME
ncbi:universal stress protein [Eudoraea sp.]|uniref:universal stress protein n=1 Tax=Eudoraea sp. TaxID=1979955 RepID=UPI003C772842